MTEEKVLALVAKLKDDAGLREKLKGAGDLDTAIAIAREAGFDVSKAALLKYQAKQTLELSDEELERAAGGFYGVGKQGDQAVAPMMAMSAFCIDTIFNC